MAESLPNKNFKYIGGDPAVDFVNTVGGWTHRSTDGERSGYRDVEVRDKLEDYLDLLHWGTGAGIVTEDEARRLAMSARRSPRAAEDVLDRAIRLRRAIYRILLAQGRDRATFQSDMTVLNTELSLARSRQRLISGNRTFELGWQSDESLDRVLWPVTVAAARLLTKGDLSRLRQCAGTDCGWLFLDKTKNRSRTWCVMNDCGNVAKVRRFRQRQKAETPRAIT